MIGPLVRISWLALVRDRYALVLSFLVPIAFFSILALVFGGLGGSALPPVRVVVLDDDRSAVSALLLTALERESALVVERPATDAGGDAREIARRLVRGGDAPVAIVVPAGFGAHFARFPAETVTVELFSDRTADPVAHHLVGGLLQRAIVLAAPDRLVRGVTRWVEEEAGALTAAQRDLLDEIAGSVGASSRAVASPFQVVVTDVQAASGREGRNVVSYYAAGIGVMFLLFTMTTAMRSLSAEQEIGTLERLLSTGLSMQRLLVARWMFATALGCVQLGVMFLWGWAVFGVDLFGKGHLPGVLVMTIASAAAAATFGLVLGTACRTPAQLQGLGTVVILLMSALGGSMVPRYLMSAGMQRLGLVTFNAWAVIGYEKVFWHDAPIAALLPQAAVLGGMTVAGLAIAGWLGRRWESA
jgi:ABC-2 type transport system permease protein